MSRFAALSLTAFLLAACSGESAPAQTDRIPLNPVEATSVSGEPFPDTSAAQWQVDVDGQAIHFGESGQDPLLSLACDVGGSSPELTVIRHARALPGESALFPVIGNGTSSRFLVDAALGDGEWRWQAKFPAADPLWDVFAGPRELTATLPGHGTLEITGSRLPGEFLIWCRSGGGSAELPVVSAPAAPAPRASPR